MYWLFQKLVYDFFSLVLKEMNENFLLRKRDHSFDNFLNNNNTNISPTISINNIIIFPRINLKHPFEIFFLDLCRTFMVTFMNAFVKQTFNHLCIIPFNILIFEDCNNQVQNLYVLRQAYHFFETLYVIRTFVSNLRSLSFETLKRYVKVS